MTQTELAERLGVSIATVSRICSDERKPSMQLMRKIESELGWPAHLQIRALWHGWYGMQFRKKMEAARA